MCQDLTLLFTALPFFTPAAYLFIHRHRIYTLPGPATGCHQPCEEKHGARDSLQEARVPQGLLQGTAGAALIGGPARSTGRRESPPSRGLASDSRRREQWISPKTSIWKCLDTPPSFPSSFPLLSLFSSFLPFSPSHYFAIFVIFRFALAGPGLNASK